MIFCIKTSLEAAGQDGLILAKRACQEFPKPKGAEVWQDSIDKIVQYFRDNKIASNSPDNQKAKQHDYSALAMGDPAAGVAKALPLHLSNLRLNASSDELGSTSAALLQWGKFLAAVIVEQKWQSPALARISGLSLEQFRLVLEGLWFGTYQFAELKSKQAEVRESQCLTIIVAESERAEMEALVCDMAQQAVALEQTLKLVLSPANICTPEFFSDFAAKQAGALTGVKTEVWGEERLTQEGMNLLLAVGRGSPRESRLLILDYCGDKNSTEHIALVGKGVCFDTGGSNLKPSASIKGMQYDMMGGAIVYGAFYYLASSGIAANIRAYVPLVENQIGSHAIKTGDIVQSAMGPTVEINNTDAEGRLILADAIHYAVQQKPKLLLDCATLTGASRVALGEQCAAFYSNNDAVADLFGQVSRETGEDVWRMPLFRPYASFLKSKLADISNISTKSSHGGSLIAALFLEKFALQQVDNEEESETKQDTCHAWLHLDLAGWSGLDEHPSLGKNARCLGVRLLAQFVRKYLEK